MEQLSKMYDNMCNENNEMKSQKHYRFLQEKLGKERDELYSTLTKPRLVNCAPCETKCSNSFQNMCITRTITDEMRYASVDIYNQCIKQCEKERGLLELILQTI